VELTAQILDEGRYNIRGATTSEALQYEGDKLRRRQPDSDILGSNSILKCKGHISDVRSLMDTSPLFGIEMASRREVKEPCIVQEQNVLPWPCFSDPHSSRSVQVDASLAVTLASGGPEVMLRAVWSSET
jgi:hypothetical protein